MLLGRRRTGRKVPRPSPIYSSAIRVVEERCRAEDREAGDIVLPIIFSNDVPEGALVRKVTTEEARNTPAARRRRYLGYCVIVMKGGG